MDIFRFTIWKMVMTHQSRECVWHWVGSEEMPVLFLALFLGFHQKCKWVHPRILADQATDQSKVSICPRFSSIHNDCLDQAPQQLQGVRDGKEQQGGTPPRRDPALGEHTIRLTLKQNRGEGCQTPAQSKILIKLLTPQNLNC